MIRPVDIITLERYNIIQQGGVCMLQRVQLSQSPLVANVKSVTTNNVKSKLSPILQKLKTEDVILTPKQFREILLDSDLKISKGLITVKRNKRVDIDNDHASPEWCW